MFEPRHLHILNQPISSYRGAVSSSSWRTPPAAPRQNTSGAPYSNGRVHCAMTVVHALRGMQLTESPRAHARVRRHPRRARLRMCVPLLRLSPLALPLPLDGSPTITVGVTTCPNNGENFSEHGDALLRCRRGLEPETLHEERFETLTAIIYGSRQHSQTRSRSWTR